MRAPLLEALDTVVERVPEATPRRCNGRHPALWRRVAAGAHAGGAARRPAPRRRRAGARLPRFCALLVKEAFKTWGDCGGRGARGGGLPALLRQRGRAHHGAGGPARPHRRKQRAAPGGRGAWVCISPWNFPLAIFMGQVAAALATGNTVLAKPAEQTPGVALEAVRCCTPPACRPTRCSCCTAPARPWARRWWRCRSGRRGLHRLHRRWRKIIQRALAAKDGPIVPLIAETGGINAMVVDSTALPEQVVDAVVQSAFRSAGQRCSALRLLCVHEASPTA
jgi:RHH-type proline utilization regulon transcriptional repressor/proline dehydrogenase/delta 1-pyrroline-5-carboxylate dehydrogenase